MLTAPSPPTNAWTVPTEKNTNNLTPHIHTNTKSHVIINQQHIETHATRSPARRFDLFPVVKRVEFVFASVFMTLPANYATNGARARARFHPRPTLGAAKSLAAESVKDVPHDTAPFSMSPLLCAKHESIRIRCDTSEDSIFTVYTQHILPTHNRAKYAAVCTGQREPHQCHTAWSTCWISCTCKYELHMSWSSCGVCSCAAFRCAAWVGDLIFRGNY